MAEDKKTQKPGASEEKTKDETKIIPEEGKTELQKEKNNKKFNFKKYLKNEAVIAFLVILLILIAGVAFAKYYKENDIGANAAKTKAQDYINNNLVQAGTKVTIKDVKADGNLYKMTVSVGGQETMIYLTKNGKKLFLQGYDTATNSSQGTNDQAAANEKTTAENKTDVPTVDLFVMSYCPYGLQMERGVIPAVEALGDKIKYNLKFVSYTLHGQKEVDENVNQYCIQKNQPDKLSKYLSCFWQNSAGTAEACMASTGVNAAQVKTCVEEAKKQYNPTEKAFDIDKTDNEKYGVQGSPTLVVNGTTISSGRDSASVLKAICSGFKNPPKECSNALSSTAPTAGFDDQAAASASTGGTASNSSCN